jgi:hypothetical protein
MIIQELENYLQKLVSPEATELMVDTARVLCESGLMSHLDDLDDIIAMEDSAGRDVTVYEIRQYLTSTLEACVNQFGVELIEDGEINLRHLTGLQRGINQITNYEDVEAIEALCLAETDPEQRLIDILELLTEYTWADYSLLIDSVSRSLFDRILELLVKPDQLAESNNHGNAVLIRVKSLISHVKAPWLLDEISDGCELGLPVAAMVERFKTRYDRVLTVSNELHRRPEMLAEQFLLYILASDCPDDRLLAVAQDQLEAVVMHVPTLSAASRAIQQLLSQVTQ